MPSATQINGFSKGSIRKFELPVLAPLDSLTAGTDIPPPLYSPIEDKSSDLAKVPESAELQDELAPEHANGHTNGVNGTAKGEGDVNGNGSISQSPARPSPPGTIRRFLSRRSMNHSYRSSNGGTEDHAAGEFRPESVMSMASGVTSSKKRNWFRRMLDGGAAEQHRLYKRTSTVFEEKEPIGPPPPTLPELSQLKAKVFNDEGSLGAEDMFKNIR